VLFKSGTSDADIEAFCEGKCKFQGHPSKQGVPFAEVDGGREQMEAMVAKHSDKIELLEPDSTDELVPEPEDAQPESASWGLERVGTGRRGRTGQGVHIYVQDTGIRVTHNDFGGRASPSIDITSDSLVVCTGDDTRCAGDRQGHGTHCAGTAGGETFGVASEAKIHAVKTLSDQGSGKRSWQMVAIDWITANGERPAVLSMSLGGRGADPSYTTSIGAATNMGVVVVVAAGNSNSDACNFSPAFERTAITVGSTTSSDSRSSFSNYGTCVQIWAPGSSIVSASASSDTGRRSLSGTSMACPHVSGAAALILAAEPSKAPAKVLQTMYDNGIENIIRGLKSSDTNSLLYVGEGGPPPAPPAPPAECPFYCGLRLCLLDACVDNCDFCKDDSLVEVANNGCKSQSDQDQIARKRSSLSDDVRNVVIGCIGQGDSCVTRGVAQMGFSSSCSQCVGTMGVCAKDNCKWTCTWNGFKSEACKSCTVDYCFDALVSCSGLPRSQLPDP